MFSPFLHVIKILYVLPLFVIIKKKFKCEKLMTRVKGREEEKKNNEKKSEVTKHHKVECIMETEDRSFIS